LELSGHFLYTFTSNSPPTHIASAIRTYFLFVIRRVDYGTATIANYYAETFILLARYFAANRAPFTF
jgi:hypothetical protein